MGLVVREFLLVAHSGQRLERASEFLAPGTRAHRVQSESPLTVKRSPDEYAEHVREMVRDFAPVRVGPDETHALDTENLRGVAPDAFLKIDLGVVLFEWTNSGVAFNGRWGQRPNSRVLAPAV